jgi:hypothetical protein
MSLDMTKSAGSITAQVPKVSHHGFVAARQRKMKRVRSPESSGTTPRPTSNQSTLCRCAAIPVADGMWSAKREGGRLELLDDEAALGFRCAVGDEVTDVKILMLIDDVSDACPVCREQQLVDPTSGVPAAAVPPHWTSQGQTSFGASMVMP